MTEDDIARFAAGLRGSLIQPGDVEYDEARKLYNAMIDKRPRHDRALRRRRRRDRRRELRRDNKLPIAVRGGGHDGPGLASVDKGLVIDLSC